MSIMHKTIVSDPRKLNDQKSIFLPFHEKPLTKDRGPQDIDTTAELALVKSYNLSVG